MSGRRRSYPRLSGMTFLDEVLAGLLTRGRRTAMTALGVVLAVCSLVALSGISSSAANRMVSRFDLLAATLVTVEGVEGDPIGIPWDVERRLEALNGVRAAGATAAINTGRTLVRSVPLVDPTSVLGVPAPVIAVSPGLAAAAKVDLSDGRFLDWGDVSGGHPVAVIGQEVATRLKVPSVADVPAIFVNDEPLTVIGVVRSSNRDRDLASSVLVSYPWAAKKWGPTTPDRVVIDTSIGAAPLVRREAPLALRPDDPATLVAASPPDAEPVRAGVERDAQRLFVLLGLIGLVGGGLGIANLLSMAVAERASEIGLRRSLGARRRQIATQFLCEATAIGAIGGICGATLGVLISVVVAAAQGWTAVLDVRLPLLSPLLGAIIGVLAGLVPARRASRLEPITALRSA